MFVLLFVFVWHFIVSSSSPLSFNLLANSGLCSSSIRDPADRENSSANTMMTILQMRTTMRMIPMGATKTTMTMKMMTMPPMEFSSPVVERCVAVPKLYDRFRIMSRNRLMKSAYKRTLLPVSEKNSTCKKNARGGRLSR